MAVQAKWYNKTFSVTPKKVNSISGFTTTFAMKQDTNDDTSGTEKLNTRGRAPEEPSFTVKYVAAAGVNPRNEFGAWRKLVGVKDYLFIGGLRYGENKFELISAAVSDTMLDNNGFFLQAVVTLTFKEDLPTPTKSNKGSATGAKNATASKTDKQLKNPYGTKSS